jgi:hypothetical protein
MKQTMNEFDFKNEFKKIRPNNFSDEGLSVLYNHLIQYEEDIGLEEEFDPIAFCCEYTEYENYIELKKDYDVDGFGILELNTTVLKIPNTSRFIIQNY